MCIDIWDDELLTLLDPQAQWEPLAGGFRFTEGPVWMAHPCGHDISLGSPRRHCAAISSQ